MKSNYMNTKHNNHFYNLIYWLLFIMVAGGAFFSLPKLAFAANTWYVATNGSDSNPCTQTQPCATFLHMTAVISPGDTVLVQPGTYGPQWIGSNGGNNGIDVTGACVSSTNPGTIGPASPLQTTFKANGTVILTYPLNPSESVQETPLLQVHNSYNVTVDGFTVIGMKGRSDQDYGAASNQHFWSDGVQISTTTANCGDPSPVGAGVIFQNLTIQHAMGNCIKSYNHESGVTYSNNIISDCGLPGTEYEHGMYIGGNNVTITGNTVSNGYGFGIQDYGAGSNNIIKNNIVSGFVSGGIVAGLPGTVIKNNVIKNNNLGVQSGGDVQILGNIIANNNLSPVVSLISTNYTGLNNGLPFTSTDTFDTKGIAFVNNGGTNELWLSSGQLHNITVVNPTTGATIATISNSYLSGNGPPGHIALIGSYVWVQSGSGFCRFQTNHTFVDFWTDTHLNSAFAAVSDGMKVYFVGPYQNIVVFTLAGNTLTYSTTYATGLSLSQPYDAAIVGTDLWIVNLGSTITRMKLADGTLDSIIDPNAMKPQTCVSNFGSPTNILAVAGKALVANNRQIWSFNADGTLDTVIVKNTNGCGGLTGITSGGQNQGSPTPTAIWLDYGSQMAFYGSTIYMAIDQYGSNTGVFLGNVNGSTVYNNTFYQNRGTELFIGLYPNPAIVKNNIIYGSGSSDNVFFNPSNTTNDYNVYYNVSPVTSNGGIHSLTLDPQFVTPGSDFHLLSSSPAIDTGTNVGITTDFDGTVIPQGNAPDIGAYEFTTISPDTTPPVISAVASSNIASSNSTITWTTNEPSDTQVEYGTTTSYGSSTTLNTTLLTAHSQTLSNLQASTLYHYRVKSRDAAGNLQTSGDFIFTTLAPPDTTPPVISGVNSTNISTTGATINWTTNENSDSKVSYGLTTSYGSVIANGILVTAHSLNLSGLSVAMLYHYQVGSSDAAGNLATSTDFTFTTLAIPPSITTQPVSQTVNAGQTATFSVVSSGTAPLSYQWMKTGVNISGATSPSYTTPATTFSDNGALFSCVISNSAGSVTSNSVTLTVNSDTTPPVISSIVVSTTSTSANITWTTNEPSTSQVEYGLTASYGSSSPLDTTLVTSHSVTLPGLGKYTTYHYRVKSQDAARNLSVSLDSTFKTKRK